MEEIKFVNAVKAHEMYDEHWLYIIHYIPIPFRERYIFTLNKDIDMPSSFDLVIASVRLSDEEYNMKLATWQGNDNAR